MNNCKLHGEYHQEECQECRANFWEEEAKTWREVLFTIKDMVFEQVPNEQVLKNIQNELKGWGLD